MIPRVLVIDDLSFYRARIRNLLRRHGYAVCEAGGAAAGIQMASRTQLDAVLLDQVVPDQSCAETIAALHAGGFTGPIVVLSPRVDPSDVEALRAAGADGVLPKTVGAEELDAELRARLSPARAA